MYEALFDGCRNQEMDWKQFDIMLYFLTKANWEVPDYHQIVIPEDSPYIRTCFIEGNFMRTK